jgi:hypothetical protein
MSLRSSGGERSGSSTTSPAALRQLMPSQPLQSVRPSAMPSSRSAKVHDRFVLHHVVGRHAGVRAAADDLGLGQALLDQLGQVVHATGLVGHRGEADDVGLQLLQSLDALLRTPVLDFQVCTRTERTPVPVVRVAARTMLG